jgi:elongation factor P
LTGVWGGGYNDARPKDAGVVLRIAASRTFQSLTQGLTFHGFRLPQHPPGQHERASQGSDPAATSQRIYDRERLMKATQLRPGMIILHEGDLYTVHSVDHRTPGNKRGAMATKMRSLRSGSIVDYRFRAEDSIERAVLDEIEFEYLYSDTEGYHFMNTETFDQIRLSGDVLGDAVYYLIPNLVLKLEFYEGKPMGAVLPDTVDLTVTDTEPTVQKATASAVMKPAKLETGLTINVPPFINNGDKVTVNTSESTYIKRAQ